MVREGSVASSIMALIRAASFFISAGSNVNPSFQAFQNNRSDSCTQVSTNVSNGISTTFYVSSVFVTPRGGVVQIWCCPNFKLVVLCKTVRSVEVPLNSVIKNGSNLLS